jgi:O-antigen/teichoic acid export membrane protein
VARVGWRGMSGSQIQRATDPAIDGVELDMAVSPARSLVRRTLRSASLTVILQGASMAVGFATSVLLARLLGGANYGRYVFALAWASLLAMPALLGLDHFLVRGIAVYEVGQKWEFMRGLLRRTNQLVLLTSMVVAGIGWMVAFLWLSGSLRWLFGVAMLFIPFTTLTLVRQGAMQAIGRVVTGQLPEYLIRPVVTLAGIGMLEFVGRGALTATTALGANVTGVAVAFVVGAVLLRRALPAVLRSVRPKYATREWLRAALPMTLVTGVWMANSYCTTLVVGTLDGPHAVGVYSVVQKGTELIVVLLIAANMPLAPAIARLHAHNDREGLQHTTERVAQATLLVSLPAAAAFAILPRVYLGLFGSSFLTGATALTIMALAQLVNSATGPAGNVLIMTGHERAAACGIGAGLIVNLVLSIVLVPWLGVTGGAIAFASSLVLWNTALVVIARRRVGVNVTAFRWLAISVPPVAAHSDGGPTS